MSLACIGVKGREGKKEEEEEEIGSNPTKKNYHALCGACT